MEIGFSGESFGNALHFYSTKNKFDFNYKKIGYKPILLLDDIFDKLDDSRVEQLVKLVGNDHFGQVFITDTQKYRIKLLMDNAVVNHKIFRVNQGVITIDDE